MSAAAKVLLVDDDPKMRALLRLSMGDHFALLEANNGQEGLDACRAEKPSLVLLDLMMPVMDGLEACRQLKQDPATRDIIVIMLTARDSRDDVRQAKEAGADDYITKPFSPRALLDAVVARIEARP